MKLTTLKSTLKRAPSRLATLTAAPQAVERKRGYAGVMDRKRIRERDGDLCRNCGQHGREVDHDIPLWAGVALGGTDDDGNKRVLCDVCHEAKTKVEAGQRATGAYDRGAVLAVMSRLARERRLI